LVVDRDLGIMGFLSIILDRMCCLVEYVSVFVPDVFEYLVSLVY